MTIAITSPNTLHTPFGAYRRAERSIRPAPVTVVGQRRAEPNYVLRRLLAAVVAVVVIATMAVGVTGLLASFGGDPASASEVSSASTEALATTHVAKSGDTMWSIASAYRGDVDHGRYVDALIRLNGGVGIEVGQAVVLP